MYFLVVISIVWSIIGALRQAELTQLTKLCPSRGAGKRAGKRSQESRPVQHKGLCSQGADGGSRCEQITSELGGDPSAPALGAGGTASSDPAACPVWLGAGDTRLLLQL